MNRIIFKRKLAEMVCQKLKQQIGSKQNLSDYQLLLSPCGEWTEKHYQLASELTEVSNSSLRRIYLPDNYDTKGFNSRTQKKYYQFLGFANWEDLETTIYKQIFEDGK